MGVSERKKREKELLREELTAGKHTVEWNGKDNSDKSVATDTEKLSQAIWGNLTGFLPGCILSANQMNKQASIKPDVVLRYIFELIQNAIKAQ